MLISQHQFLNLVPRARSQGFLLLVSRSEGRVGEVPGNEFVFGSFVTETFWVGHIRSYTLDEISSYTASFPYGIPTTPSSPS